MNSPNEKKRPMPEIYSLKSSKISKIGFLKENIPPALNDVSNQKELCNELPHPEKATPKKNFQNVEDPVTPNTNMKLLTTCAAALEYVNCSTPKSRNSNNASGLTAKQECRDEPECTEPKLNWFKTCINRKEKSLSIICTRFLDMYPLHPSKSQNLVISLGETSVKLGVERRRLYDIVNVFESINMLSKIAKNQYMWFGKTKLLNALHCLKKDAGKENIFTKLQYVLALEESQSECKQPCILDDVQDFNKHFENKNKCSLATGFLQYSSHLPELRKEKSLALMSQKFLMLFLVSPSKIISLGVAAKVLNGFQKIDGGAQIKTQIRRLYDIANVLSSIGLIQKEVTVGISGRRPAFKYIGPDLKDIDFVSLPTQESTVQRSNGKQRSLIRHSSFQEICAIAEKEHQRMCLDESANSAPPFPSSFLKHSQSLNKTDFSNLNLKVDSMVENIKSDDLVTKTSHKRVIEDELQANAKESSIDEKKRTESNVKPCVIEKQLNKPINRLKQVCVANGPLYMLNPVTDGISKCSYAIGTPVSLLLITPIASSQLATKISEDKTSKNEPTEILLKQDATSFSSAPILLHATSKMSPSENSVQCYMLKNTEKLVELNTASMTATDLLQNDIESIGSSSICSTRNNSPSSNFSGLDSPLSISSGYVTPSVLSDVSFPSCSETLILEKIEQCATTAKSSSSVTLNHIKENISTNGNFTKNDPIEVKSTQSFDSNVPVLKGKNENFEALLKCKYSTPLQEIQNFAISNNSCSNDSLNSEVSEILKGKKLGETTTKKPFLIDEKTILSPIKKHRETSKNMTPSPFITPPYITSESYFFNFPAKNSRHDLISKVPGPSLLNIKNSVKDDNGWMDV